MDRIIPALTLWQPWACLIEIGAKRYETRGKPPPKRLLGRRVAIHAAARPCFTDLPQAVADDITKAFGFGDWSRRLPRGVVVCTARIAGAVPVEEVLADSFGDYAPGRWAWRLEDVVPIAPHAPAKGMQSWGWPWKVPDDIALEWCHKPHPRLLSA